MVCMVLGSQRQKSPKLIRNAKSSTRNYYEYQESHTTSLFNNEMSGLNAIIFCRFPTYDCKLLASRLYSYYYFSFLKTKDKGC